MSSSTARRRHPARAGHQALSRRPLADARRSRSRRISTACAAGRDDVHSATRGKIDATIWALRDVTFEVPAGAGLGVIGRNGAGKTTLLKLISRVTWPTSGRVRVAGRVVSLIELGAGFHPELTGRENVYLGGGLFGLTRTRDRPAVRSRSSQFADVERLIDTPMKRYSSGLYARLGFASRFTADPDIVLVDEVLAVGDAAFRRRALEALRQLIADGKTVLFISHDMWNVRRLCDQILWMEEGRVRAYGPAGEIAERYMSEVNLAGAREPGRRRCRATAAEPAKSATPPSDLSTTAGAASVLLPSRATRSSSAPRTTAPSARSTGRCSRSASSTSTPAWSSPPRRRAPATCRSRSDGDGTIECRFPALPLRPRQYILRLAITDSHQLASYDVVTAGPRFAVSGHGSGRRRAGRRRGRPGVAAVRVRASRRRRAGRRP